MHGSHAEHSKKWALKLDELDGPGAPSNWTGALLLRIAGGFVGLLLTALLALYLAAAEVINETHGRALLPLGTH